MKPSGAIKANIYVFRAHINHKTILRLSREVNAEIRFPEVTRLIRILFVFTVSVVLARGTSIVVVKQGNTTFLGADSRVNYTVPGLPLFGGSLCKIKQIAPNQFVAISGTAWYGDYNSYALLTNP
jgi:hypothetical protein